MNKATIAEWNFDTNVTDANKEILALARNAVYILQEYTFRTVVMSINVTTAKIEVSPSLPPSARKIKYLWYSAFMYDMHVRTEGGK